MLKTKLCASLIRKAKQEFKESEMTKRMCDEPP